MYRDPILQHYIDKIKEDNSDIEKFYQGDPIKIPKSALPACVLSRNTTTASEFDTGQTDQHAQVLRLIVVTDIRQDIGGDEDLAYGISKLYEIMEGRDSDFSLKDSSILKIIRKKRDEGDNLYTDIGAESTIDYKLTFDARDIETYSIEAEIQFTAFYVEDYAE